MMRKSVKIMALLAILGLGALAGVTQAYLTDYQTLKNSFRVGENTTDITEEFPPVTPVPPDEDPKIPKTISVKNTSGGNERSVDCYVRIRLAYSDLDIGGAVAISGLNDKDWIYDQQDGYYYYREILPAGATTKPLCTGFSIDGSQVEDTYSDLWDELSIQVYEESVQADGFSGYQDAWEYYGNVLANR